MEKYIITSDSIINVSAIIRFTANPEGEIKIECKDGISARLVEGTYRGKVICDKMKHNFVNFLRNDKTYWMVKEEVFTNDPYGDDMENTDCISI